MAKIAADFTNVEDGFQLVPEGDYVGKVTKVTVEEGDKGKYFAVTITIGTGEMKGQKLFRNLSMSPKALWMLRSALIAMGVDVPKSKFVVDTDQMMGKVVGISVGHGEWKGKKKAEVTDLWKAVKTEQGWKRADGGSEKAKAQEADEEEESLAANAPQADEDDEDIEI